MLTNLEICGKVGKEAPSNPQATPHPIPQGNPQVARQRLLSPQVKAQKISLRCKGAQKMHEKIHASTLGN